MRHLIFFGILFLSTLVRAQEPMIIKYMSNVGLSEDYYLKIITRAMEITAAEYGDFRVDFMHQSVSSERLNEFMITGEQINVARIIGLPRQGSLPGALLRMDFPLLRGFMGFRILLIRADTQPMFAKINTLDELIQVPMGIGKGWEGYIYRHQHFQMTEPVAFDVLLKMLAGKRYDFIPLGAYEIEDNYKVKNEFIGNLVPENHLLIAYHLPVSFYVSPAEPMLAKRLQKGLNALNESGEANNIFDHFFAARLKALNIKNRRVIRLVNPELPANQQQLDLSLLKNY